MAAGAWLIYAKAKYYIGKGDIQLGTTKMRMALLRQSATTLGITSLSTRSTWASIKADEIAIQGGYLAHGRKLLPSLGYWTVGSSAKQYKFTYSTTGLVFTASGASLVNIRYAVIMASTTASAGRLICYCELSTAQFSITSPNTLTITPHASGVFTLA